MYKQIKGLAEEALKLQNKNVMDEALREIVGICGKELEWIKQEVQRQLASEIAGNEVWPREMMPALKRHFDAVMSAPQGQVAATHECVTYGTAKQFDTEAELIANIQGVASPAFPLPADHGFAGEASTAIVAGQAVKFGDAVIIADGVAEPATASKTGSKKGGAK